MASPGGSAKVLYIGLDACDVGLMKELAAAGRCPHLARLLEEGAVADTTAPYGTFVSSSWLTITTGSEVGHLGYWNWLAVDPETYALRETTPREASGTPFWETLSSAGRRVAVVDVPHMTLPAEFNGIALKEWGCHDRHDGTASQPAGVLDALDRSVGRHPIGCSSHPRGDLGFAPCDSTLREGRHRTLDEERRLVDLIRWGVDAKHRASAELLAQGPWDLFITVLGEGHCAGHQLWHVHDDHHPRHDAGARQLLGDPVEDTYVRLDAVMGDLIARAGADATVYVQMNHGMAPHYDGDHLLDVILERIDDALGGQFAPGPWSRAGTRFLALTPRPGRHVARQVLMGAARRRARRVMPPPSVTRHERADRRWYQIPGNTAVGAVRFNVAGREARGTIQPGAELDRLRDALAAELLELINVDTGQPLVQAVVRSEEVVTRRPHDSLPDLFVEWNRSAPIERAWSPTVGIVVGTYEHWRTGDHGDRGVFIARGPGLSPGAREPMVLVDTAPTLAAALGVDLAVDGRPRLDLVGSPPVAADAGTRRVARALQSSPRGSRRGRAPETDATAVGRTALDLAALATTRLDRLEPLIDRGPVARPEELDDLRRRLAALERERSVWATMAWLAREPVADGPLITVITPTHPRPGRLAEAIRSVQAQRHPCWEMVVVDDGSDTAKDVVAEIGNERVRALAVEHGGPSRARNVGLDDAAGEIITYLDDDNRLDPGWLHAVAWAFQNHPGDDVLYGARVFDDSRRPFGLEPGGWPWLQFEPFDRGHLERDMMADMGVIAHRAGLGARFDEAILEPGDWDFFLTLTEDRDPLELPAIALYYRTDLADRLSGTHPDEMDFIRAKWAERRAQRGA